MTTDTPQEQPTPSHGPDLRPYEKSGGATTLAKYGPEHFREAGKKSAEVRGQKYGKEYYAELGRKSVEAKRAKKKRIEAAKVKWENTIKEKKKPTAILSKFLLGKL